MRGQRVPTLSRSPALRAFFLFGCVCVCLWVVFAAVVNRALAGLSNHKQIEKITYRSADLHLRSLCVGAPCGCGTLMFLDFLLPSTPQGFGLVRRPPLALLAPRTTD